MYAVIKSGGQQHRVKKGDVISHDYIKNTAEGDEIPTLGKVLMLSDDDKNIIVNSSELESVKVVAKVLEHAKDKKIRVFKYKRRKNYKISRGFRRMFTKIEIRDIAAPNK